jgi:hypothetical protein
MLAGRPGDTLHRQRVWKIRVDLHRTGRSETPFIPRAHELEVALRSLTRQQYATIRSYTAHEEEEEEEEEEHSQLICH